ncbi:peptide deformylase [Streptomyces sp. NPDC058066]|uniref:peptide deformylase n=1 Tax=Streptomyces sp. NPDC058066 TaxID=3346323 RepID=UPI0036E41206
MTTIGAFSPSERSFRISRTTVTTVYERGLARLIHHEIDHLDGLLYTARMRTGVDPIPVEEYRQTGRAWAYE